jgi:hypothetical protein
MAQRSRGAGLVKRSHIHKAGWTAPAIVLLILLNSTASGYGVFTHQAIIKFSWKGSVTPVLLAKFPAATEQELKAAEGYAYAGAVIQDMGYFPFASGFYSDLAHYVRSGEFVQTLIAEAQTLDEYAFALGALEHYAADNNGHPIATNRAVPEYYPDLRRKYGNTVTYEQSPSAHKQTEFGFDVVEVAERIFDFDTYNRFIGFDVSREVLERAFKKIYGLELEDIFTIKIFKLFTVHDLGLAIGSYRYSVSKVIPEATRLAWLQYHEEVQKNPEHSNLKREAFVYRHRIAKSEKSRYKAPGFYDKALLFIAQTFGLSKQLKFQPPTKKTKDLYLESYRATQEEYRKLLAQVKAGTLHLENTNFDTGRRTRAGEYGLADAAYSKLLRRLADKHFAGVTAELRANILAFYADPNASTGARRNNHEWRATLRALDQLKAATVPAGL